MNLIIRKMCENDLHPLYELLSNTKVMAYLEPPYSLSQTESFLRDAGLSECPLVYAVTDNGRFIGYVIYHEYHDDNNMIEMVWKQAGFCFRNIGDAAMRQSLRTCLLKKHKGIKRIW